MPPKSVIPVLEPQQIRTLMKEFNLEFYEPRPASSWPKQYAKWFRKIRDIGRTYYEDLENNKKSDLNDHSPNAVNELIDRARRLRQSAVPPGNDPVNEATLRGNTEHLVFFRLLNEARCRICKGYLWIAEFRALPTDPVDAEKLEKRRAQRNACQCSMDQQTSDRFDLKAGRTLFDSFLEDKVLCDPAERLVERGVKQRKPDRIIALKTTESVAQIMTSFDQRHNEPRLKHSPFKRSGLVYPFLIVESKSEDNSPGFEAIQRQTAFPIRRCLQLQQGLQRASGQPLDPLVWFLAYQADEWRVSACIVNNDKYQVFDIWLNRISDISGALQLLRIIDYIADWAQDIYRPNIVSCLAGGDAYLRQYRGGSIDSYGCRLSTQPSLLGSDIIHVNGPLVSRNVTPSPVELDITMGDSLLTSNNEEITESEEPAPHPFLRWMTSHLSQQDTLARELTIRHSNMISFDFLHLPIPENTTELVSLLRMLIRPMSISSRAMAAALWTCTSSNVTSVATTLSQVHRIKMEWLKLTPTVLNTKDDSVRTLFSFRTYVRSSDWQVVRELTCISCTASAAQGLAACTGVQPQIASTDWAIHTAEFSLSPFGALRALTGKWSAMAAVSSAPLYLGGPKHSLSGISWVAESDADTKMILCFSWITGYHQHELSHVVFTESQTMAVIRKRVPVEITKLFPPSPIDCASAVLFRLDKRDSYSTATWCLMVYEDVDFEDNESISKILANVKAKGVVFTLERDHRTDRIVAVNKTMLARFEDRGCVDRWLENLRS